VLKPFCLIVLFLLYMVDHMIHSRTT